VAHSETSTDLGAFLIAQQLVGKADLSDCLREWNRLQKLGVSVALQQLLIDRAGLSMAQLAQRLLQRKRFLVVCGACGSGRVLSDPRPSDCRACSGRYALLVDWPGGAETTAYLSTARAIGPGRPAAPASAQREGKLIGRYQLGALLGRGGMGDVYLAEDPAFGRQVALKVLRLDRRQGQELLQRFKREGRLLSTIEHPNVVRILDLDPDGLPPFLVMEYVEGQTLEQLLDGGCALDEALDMLSMAACGLAATHAQGIIHRDLKPANILIDGLGVAKVTDFGLAKRMDGQTMLTRTGQSLGTPAYMSPEQITGDPQAVGPEADVYALGILLYRILTGQLPFAEKRVVDLFSRTVTEDVPSPRLLRPELSRALDAVCRKATRCAKAQRYGSAAEFHQALRQAREAPAPRWDSGLIAKHGWKPALAAALLLLIVGLFSAGERAGRLPRAQAPGWRISPPAASPVSRSPRLVWRKSHGLEQAMLLGLAEGVLVLYDQKRGQLAGVRAVDGLRVWASGGSGLRPNIEQARVIGNQLYLRYDRDVEVLRAATGKTVWRLPDAQRARLGGRPFMTLFGRDTLYLSCRKGFGPLTAEGKLRWWIGGTHGPPDAIDARADKLVVMPEGGGVLVLSQQDGAELQFIRPFRRPANNLEELTVRLAPDSGLVAICRGDKLLLKDWNKGPRPPRWRVGLEDGNHILELDRQAVYTVCPGSRDSAFAAYDRLDGRRLLVVAAPACAVWREGAAYVVSRGPERGLQMMRVSGGRAKRGALQMRGAIGKPARLVSAGKLGLILAVGDQLVGLDPERLQLLWQYGPVGPQAWPVRVGRGRIAVVDAREVRLIEVGQ